MGCCAILSGETTLLMQFSPHSERSPVCSFLPFWNKFYSSPPAKDNAKCCLLIPNLGPWIPPGSSLAPLLQLSMPFIHSDLCASLHRSPVPIRPGRRESSVSRILVEPKLPEGQGTGFQLPLLYPFPTEQLFSPPMWGQQGELCFPLIAAD